MDAGELFVRVRPTTAGFTQEASGPIAAAGRDLSRVFLAAFAVGGIATTIEGVVKAATEHQAAFAVLAQVTRDAGASNTAYGKTVESLLEQEARLKGFSDEELAAAFQRLVSVTHNSELAFTQLGKAEDLARFRHIDLASAALILTKLDQGRYTALQRIGIVVQKVTTDEDALTLAHQRVIAAGGKLTESDKERYASALAAAKAADAQATSLNALAEVEARTGGAAATFAQTASGQFARLQQDFHQFEVAIGTTLLSGLAGAAEGLGGFFTHLTQSGEAGRVAATASHDLGVGLHDLGAIAETVGPPLLTVAKAAIDVVDAVGAPALLTAVATYKAVGIATGLAATAEAFYTRVLLANQGVTIAATAENVALADSYDAVALSSALAAGERGIGAFASGLATLGAGAVASPAGIAISVTALAAGIVYLVTQEDSWTAANHRLTGSLGDLTKATQDQSGAQGQFAQEAAASNRAAAIEQVAAALGHLGDAAVQKTLPPIDPLARGMSILNTLNERSALLTGRNAQAVQLFTHAIGEQVLALGKSNPLLEHQLELAGELAQRLGRPPTREQFDLILNTATAKESLDQFLAYLVGIRPDFTAAGNDLGSAFGDGFALNLKRSLTPQILSSGTFTDPALNTAAVQAGQDLLKSLRDGITTDQTDLASIRQQLADAVIQGAQAVDQAVQQAKQNLNTIGAGLAASIGTFIDKPLTDAATRISNAQDKIGAAASRLGLQQLGDEVSLPGGKRLSRDPAAAVKELQELQASITRRTGAADPALANFLIQYRTAALGAESGSLKVRQDLANKEKQDAVTRIANLTDELNKGVLSVPAFDLALSKILAANHLTFIAAARRDGIAFADTFAGQLTGLGLQEAAIRGGPQRAGTGLIPAITRPLDTLEQTQKTIAGLASQERSKQLDESKKQTQLLQKIHAQQAVTQFTNSLSKNPGQESAKQKALAGVGG